MGVVIMDEERMKSKEFKTSDHGNDYPPRSVPPSPTQLWLARATIRSLVDEQSPYVAHSMMKEADLPKETVRMRTRLGDSARRTPRQVRERPPRLVGRRAEHRGEIEHCLLYTSDAADE